MSKTHRLTPEQWEPIERYADDNTYDACFLELRARIEALEVGAACPHVSLRRCRETCEAGRIGVCC